jgi:fructosamine-3-kinase
VSAPGSSGTAEPGGTAGDVGERVRAATGRTVTGATRIGGGDTATAWRCRLDDGRTVLAKVPGGADPDPAAAVAAEAHGLGWLAEAGAARVPAVVAVVAEASTAVLVLEWIESGPPAGDHDERLGRELAALHRVGAPGFGLDRPNRIGPLTQDNRPTDDWPDFFARRRIEPLVRAAIDAGLLPAEAGALAERLAERLPALAGPAEPPARLHGDLWAGNALIGPVGEPVLIDPAVHGGHREVDLAMMRLFGGFPQRVHAAYDEAFPLADGHGERVSLWQLHPLLVHTVLFGGSYARAALTTLRRYA